MAVGYDLYSILTCQLPPNTISKIPAGISLTPS